MRAQALRARPRRRRLPADKGERSAEPASNVLDRQFVASVSNRKWIADFTYIWTAEGWLYVAVVIDLFSRRVVGWSMSATMLVNIGLAELWTPEDIAAMAAFLLLEEGRWIVGQILSVDGGLMFRE